MKKIALVLGLLSAATVFAADQTLTVYSGRTEELVAPILERFKQESGIDIKVRYGQTPEMAATILEEGDNSPADVFYGQDAGTLGALGRKGRLDSLPQDIQDLVPARYRDSNGHWIGISARIRCVVYNSTKLKEQDLPDDIWGFCDPKWKGRLGWAPGNASFQAFVTMMRRVEGDDKAREWLTKMKANEPSVYPKNGPIVAAVGAGEIDAGFVNHYYLFKAQDEQGTDFPAQNYYLRAGGPASMINVSGAGIVNTSKHKDAAAKLIRFLLAPEAQKYFAGDDYEYPLAGNVPTDPRLVPLDQVKSPALGLGNIEDLDGTVQMLQDVGIL